jgi:hypothetical protein
MKSWISASRHTEMSLESEIESSSTPSRMFSRIDPSNREAS